MNVLVRTDVRGGKCRYAVADLQHRVVTHHDDEAACVARVDAELMEAIFGGPGTGVPAP